MKPLQLEFQAFGPYPEQEHIDFEMLACKGLFLICGETGSGKTVMLDAITFALYGKSSGNMRNDFEAMRCTSAKADVSTFVRFVFETGGDVYLFERKLERKQKNFKASYNLMKKDENGDWKTLLENPKEKELNKKAVELIGLDYDQFRQVIILPQGQFEKLLTSKSEDKEKILSDIFGEYKWQRIADKMFEAASERKETLRSKKEKIQNSLEEENCHTMQQLSELITAKEAALRIIQKEYDEADYKNQMKAINEALVLAGSFAKLHKLEEQQKEYLAGQEKRNTAQKTLENAKRADKVRQSILNVRTKDENLQDRKRAYQSILASEKQYEQRVKQASLELVAHNEKKEKMEELRNKLAGYENRRQDYQGISLAQKECDEKEHVLQKAIDEEKKERSRLASYDEKLLGLNREYEEKKALHERLLDSYLLGIHGQIAKELMEGKPCPVCGSIEHPNRAPLADDSVTKEAVEHEKQNVDQKHKELLACGEKQKEAEARYKASGERRAAALVAVAGVKAALQSMTSNLIEGVTSLEMLEKNISEMSGQLAEYEEKRQRLEQAEKKAQEAYTQIKTKIAATLDELEKAREQYENANDFLLADVKKNGFSSAEEAKAMLLSLEEMEALQQKITRYDTNLQAINDRLKEMREELSNKEEPDVQLCQKKLEQTEAADKEFTSRRAMLSAEYKRLYDKEQNLLAEGNGMENAIKQADEDVIFAKKMRGDTGTGLQRYVLGIMFSSVVAAANKLLELVHNGRYRLFRSDDKMQGTNKRGLELKVYDKFSDDPAGRFVNTLSGGEKFLVSLALSIGMSTVAQKSGIKIEALFIDEGFGSLDGDSIEDAMNVLNTIQASNGLVGIISHVQLLQDRIPTKLIVSKKEGRSHMKETIG